jgi:hypothetical protein
MRYTYRVIGGINILLFLNFFVSIVSNFTPNLVISFSKEEK